MASTLPSHSWSRAPGCHCGERLRGSRRGGGATCWLFGSELKLFRHLESFYPIGGRGDSIWREQVATLFPNTLTDFIQTFWHFLFPNIFGNNSCEHNWGNEDKSYQINHLKCSLGHTWKLTIVVFTGGYYLSKRYIDWQKSVFIGRTKELICFKRVVELRSRPPVEVLPDIRLGSKADQNSLATRHWWK